MPDAFYRFDVLKAISLEVHFATSHLCAGSKKAFP
jgi:hypothetical protein